jgi:hypothetical protein
MSDCETETLLGHDPSYIENFVGADDVDGFEDFEVEPDTFHGVCCPPAPISSRISYLCLLTCTQSNWHVLFPTGERVAVRVGPVVLGVNSAALRLPQCADRQRMVSRFLFIPSHCQSKEQVQRSPRWLL